MNSKKVYIKSHDSGAGAWIYLGYKNAWSSLGYETLYFTNLDEISEEPGSYYLQAVDSDINTKAAYQAVKNAKKAFIFAQTNSFPSPWGTHPNFQCHCPDEYIELLNNLSNVYLWSFTNTKNCTYHDKWKDVQYIPLAFDDVAYQPEQEKKYEYDICYVGGFADNGFNEKTAIMQDYFSELSNLGLNLGISINQNISMQEEANLLYNSKIAINIHDKYQHVLGLDSNERTFKSLGLNGFLISDDVKEVGNLFSDVPLAKSPRDMCRLVEKYLDEDLSQTKVQNRNLILEKHTYKNRVRELLSL